MVVKLIPDRNMLILNGIINQQIIIAAEDHYKLNRIKETRSHLILIREHLKTQKNTFFYLKELNLALKEINGLLSTIKITKIDVDLLNQLKKLN